MEFKNLVLIIVALGLFATLISVRRARRRRYAASTRSGVSALVLLGVAALLSLGALNMRTYDRLTHEELAADLRFSQKSPGVFDVTVTDAKGRERLFSVQGDEWQLDARMIKWKGFVNVIGMDALYRLERLSGRYRNIDQERSQPRSVYALSNNAGPDLWALAQEHQKWLPWMDAQYGSATYLPMADGAHYQALVTQSGLIAKPVNEAASHALQEWNK